MMWMTRIIDPPMNEPLEFNQHGPTNPYKYIWQIECEGNIRKYLAAGLCYSGGRYLLTWEQSVSIVIDHLGDKYK